MKQISKHCGLSARAILFLHTLVGGLFISGLAINPFAAQGQVVLSSAAPKTENFDGMGASGTATAPAGIRLSGEAAPTFASPNNYTQTTVASNGGSTNAQNISSGGTYNFLSGVGSTDRALGFLNSGSYGTPRSIMLAVANSSGTTIQDLTVQFNLEKYRSGSREYNWTFFTSPDGTTWTAHTTGAQNYPADPNNTVYYAPPLTVAKTVSLPGVNLANGTTYYLRWTQTGVGGSTNGQAAGLDDVTLTPTLAGGTPAASIATGAVAPASFCLTAAGSAPFNVAYSTSSTFTGTYKVQLSDATGAFPASTTAGIIGTGSSSPISATIPAGTAAGTKYRVRVLNDAPITYGTDNGADLSIGQTPDGNPVAVTPAAAQSVATTGTGATLTATAAASSTFVWQYGSTATGPFTPIAGATAAAYQLKGGDFPGAGTYYVVAQATLTNACGTATGVSTPVSVNVTTPVVTSAFSVSATSLPDFSNVAVGAGSQAKSFTVSGTSLTGNIVITPPAGFEIRTGANPFACCAIELAPVGGNVPSTTIEVRFAPTAAQGAQAAIPVTSPGLPNQAVAVSGTGIDAVYPATLGTTPVTDLATTTATAGGNVTLDGGSAVTARGVMWAKTANPILSTAPGATKTVDGAGTGTFSSALTGLVPGTTYFVRAYATNGVSTAYGDELSFTTVAVPLAAEPTTPAALTASQVTGSSLVLNLTGGDGAKRLVIARLGSPVDAAPVDATTYTANSEFGKGSNLGRGNFVVYSGTANADTITNLRPNTSYYFSVFAFSDNNTPYAENYLTTTPGTLTQATPAIPPTLLLEENFVYTASSLLTANGWTAHSGGGTRPVAVTTNGLSYPGYGPNSGNAAAVVANGEDVNRTFDAVYARTPVYASLLVNVSNVNTTGDYFFHLGPKVIGSTFRGRVWVKRVGTTNKVVFGVGTGSGAAATYTTTEYDLNATHLLVLKYTFDEADNTSELFVNPTTDTEPATASARSAETGTTPAAPNDNIGAVALRQGSASPTLLVDGIRVGTTYRVVKTGLTCFPPVASFTAAPVCVGTPTAFVDASTNLEANATYAWDINNDGTTDFTTKGNSSYTYAEAGVYTVKLTVTQGTCSDSFTQQVTVRALPTAALSGDATVCTGETATLTLRLTGTAPWTLSYSADGGATSTPLTVSAAQVNAAGNYLLAVTPTATTTYSLTALTDSTTCVGTALAGTATVTVTTPPVLTVPTVPTANTTATECGASVAFAAAATGSPAPVVTYSIVKDGAATAIASPFFFPVGATTVTATATNGCGTDTETFVVTVQDKQAPTVLTQNLTVALSGGTATITAAQVDNGSTDACGIATLALSKTTFDCGNIGANTVTLTVTDIHGNTATRTATVNVTGTIPAPTITVAPTSTVYTGGVAQNLYLGYGPQSVTLTASGGVSYQWSPAAGLSNAASAAPVFTATTPGTFTFTVTATSASGCTATQRVTLRVIDVRCGNKNDKVSLCQKGKPKCVSSSEVADYLRNGSTLGDCSPSKPNALGSGTAQRNAAQTAAATTQVFEAYPNPFTERTLVHFRAASTGPAQLELYNAVGQVVKTFYNGVAQEGQDYEFTLDGATLPAGMYTGRLRMDGKVEVLRLVLTK
ncbi:MAG TPA: T9SS type A sorting domain-containing protein [Hymenobacter sp.]|jgi:PKD repeat protein/Ni,Fe-hydrogenase III small subunit|uniref:T9SS type A sorting domain-containing protein n=1 Tax=Hymenobacter sp. TaxID=1898978 RepID=UPI002EDA8BEA